MRQDRSSRAPGAEAALDQSAAAVESGFLFNQSADFRFAIAHGLRERAMPESLGMLEPGYRYFYDCWRSLHAGVRILRRHNGETIHAGRRRTEAGRRMNLKHVVITAVARDDLKDGGADHFARTITAIREMDPSIIIEVLVPDFHSQDWCIRIVLDAAPDIYNHNMETVERLTPLVRSRAKYRTSLRALWRAKELSP